jgi:hypothetical protein
MSFKIRKVGTSNVLTVPNKVGEVGAEYNVYSGREGALVYLPATKNPFTDKKFIEEHRFNGDMTGFVEAGVENNEQ